MLLVSVVTDMALPLGLEYAERVSELGLRGLGQAQAHREKAYRLGGFSSSRRVLHITGPGHNVGG